MNTTQRWTIAIIVAVAIAVALFAGGIALGRADLARRLAGQVALPRQSANAFVSGTA